MAERIYLLGTWAFNGTFQPPGTSAASEVPKGNTAEKITLPLPTVRSMIVGFPSLYLASTLASAGREQ